MSVLIVVRSSNKKVHYYSGKHSAPQRHVFRNRIPKSCTPLPSPAQTGSVLPRKESSGSSFLVFLFLLVSHKHSKLEPKPSGGCMWCRGSHRGHQSAQRKHHPESKNVRLIRKCLFSPRHFGQNFLTVYFKASYKRNTMSLR